MHISWTCTAMRLAPIGVLLLVHCSRGHWPSDQVAMERAMDYGFSVDLLPERPTSIITHLFVHISSEHLLSNVFSLAATLIEFGGLTMRGNIEEGRKEVAMQRTIGSFLIMIVGGVLGGLGGQLLYNDSKLHRRRQEVARLRFQSTHDGQDVGAVITSRATTAYERLCRAIPLGSAGAEPVAAAPDLQSDGVLRTLIHGIKAGVNHLQWRARIWTARTLADLQEGINNSMLMCGASAGICAIAGFNLTYFCRPATTMCLVVPELFALGYEAYGRYASALAEGTSASVEGGWRTLMPGQTVGHAAHVGGFAVGAALGLLWRRRMLRCKNNVRGHA